MTEAVRQIATRLIDEARLGGSDRPVYCGKHLIARGGQGNQPSPTVGRVRAAGGQA